MTDVIDDRPMVIVPDVIPDALESGRARAPDITVVMITFNHRRYVAQAVESVFMQRYPGKVTLVVSDDCSTDGTQTEIKRLRERAPIPMEVILRDTNVGGLENLSQAWQRAAGKYIALLEGDDYWTLPTKLAIQAAALEAHPQAMLAFGRADALDETVAPPVVRPLRVPFARPTKRDLLSEDFVPTCTVLYRRGVVREFPDWFASAFSRDWPLHLLHAAAGDVIYVDGVLAVHRLHGGGRWSAIPIRERVIVLEKHRNELWRRFGSPPTDRRRWLRARSLVAVAMAAESRRELISSLVAAARAWPAVAGTRGFWYAVARGVVGDRAARRLGRLSLRR